FAPMSQISLAGAETDIMAGMINAILEPSRETDHAKPWLRSKRDDPGRTEILHMLAFPDSTRLATSHVESGNHAAGVQLSRPLVKAWGGAIVCISPVPTTLMRIPASSEYARYFPSGEMTGQSTGFSPGLAVKRCCLISARGNCPGVEIHFSKSAPPSRSN